MAAGEPLSLNSENPHYFQFRGQPTIIITSGEHYGAVLNLDFDYARYLKTLAKDGLNCTRTWSGAYYEPADAFSIASNSMAPASCRFICPWARSSQPGYVNGGNKFDLSQWDEIYFMRLRDFVWQANERGIVVEMNLFCPFYEESMWKLSPMNAVNNVNDIGSMARTNVYTLDKSGNLLAVQDAMVRKIVTELKGFDNLYYEICNEPYFGGVTLEWQRHIADVIVATEKELGVSHLISQNIANGEAKIENPISAVSIFNFHYTSPPNTVAMNCGLNKVIGENETGFRGTNETFYRMEAWDFIVAGGGLYNNLDYSFTVGREKGTFIFPESQPGCGNPEYRRQLHFLSEFMRQHDFIHMHPANELLTSAQPAGLTARVLANPGKDYIVYFRTVSKKDPGAAPEKASYSEGQIGVDVTLPNGKYKAEWINPKEGKSVRKEHFSCAGAHRLNASAFTDDAVLVIQSTR